MRSGGQQPLIGVQAGQQQQACLKPCAPPCKVAKVAKWKRYLIEGIATYFIILIILFVAQQYPNDLLLVALSQGVAVYVGSSIFYQSGPHANGVVTLLSVVHKLQPATDFLSAFIYLAVQAGFSILAALTLWGIMPAGSSLGITVLDTASYSAAQGLLSESIAAFIVYMTILVVAGNYHKPGREALMYNVPNLVVGLSVTAAVLVSGSISGAAINPWRHLAPAAISGNFASYSWIYYIGPLIGALVASLVFMLLSRDRVVRTR